MKRKSVGKGDTPSQGRALARSRPERRVFFLSLGLALCVLLTALGLVTVDYRGRCMSFGDNIPPFHVEKGATGGTSLEVRVMGLETEMDITGLEKFWEFLLDFGCIPHR